MPIQVIGASTVQSPPLEAVEETLKRLLATPGEQIQLDDFVSRHVRAALEATSLESFPVQGVDDTKKRSCHA